MVYLWLRFHIIENRAGSWTRATEVKEIADVRKRVYDDWLRELQPGVHEVVIHPSYMSSEWSGIIGDFNSYMRLGDYKYWSDPETKVLAEKLGIIYRL